MCCCQKTSDVVYTYVCTYMSTACIDVGMNAVFVPMQQDSHVSFYSPSSSCMQTAMFAVTPRSHCDHIDGGLSPVPVEGLDSGRPCRECSHVGENWVCLSCYEVCMYRAHTHTHTHRGVVGLYVCMLLLAHTCRSLLTCSPPLHSGPLQPLCERAHGTA